jgi:hypothetical protein
VGPLEDGKGRGKVSVDPLAAHLDCSSLSMSCLSFPSPGLTTGLTPPNATLSVLSRWLPYPRAVSSTTHIQSWDTGSAGPQARRPLSGSHSLAPKHELVLPPACASRVLLSSGQLEPGGVGWKWDWDTPGVPSWGQQGLAPTSPWLSSEGAGQWFLERTLGGNWAGQG